MIKGSTIVWGKISECIFPKCKRFVCTQSFVNSVDMCFKPFSDQLNEMTILNNDFYGTIQFNLVFHVVYFRERFKNLERLDFEGQIEETCLLTLLQDMDHYPRFKSIKLKSKGAFFNTKILVGDPKLQEL